MADRFINSPNNLNVLNDSNSSYVHPTMLDSQESIDVSHTLHDVTADSFTKFNKFRLHDGDPLTSGIGYIFFTKPDLNLTEQNLNSDNFFQSLAETDFGKKVMSNLTNYISLNSSNSNFITLLTNTAENFDTKDIQAKTGEFSENFVGYKLSFPEEISESLSVDSFSVNYVEYSDLRITYLHKMWIDYIQYIRKGKFIADQNHIENRIIDYMSSVFFFLCGEDGHSIKYYSKLTGVYPTNIPYSAFSWQLGQPGLKKLSITYQYSFKEDLDPQILMDFMAVSKGTISKSPDTLKNNWANNVGISDDGKLYFGD